MSFNGYGWYLSSTAALLYCSWVVHNVVAWMKIKPFLVDTRSMFKPETGKWIKRIYLGTLACTVRFQNASRSSSVLWIQLDFAPISFQGLAETPGSHLVQGDIRLALTM